MHVSVQSQLVSFIKKKTVYNEILVYCLKICTSIAHIYSIKTKILSMLGPEYMYFPEIAKINSQQKTICPNHKN